MIGWLMVVILLLALFVVTMKMWFKKQDRHEEAIKEWSRMYPKGIVPYVEDDEFFTDYWTCPSCRVINSIERERCTRCWTKIN